MQRPIGREDKFTFSPCVEVRSSTNRNLGVKWDSLAMRRAGCMQAKGEQLDLRS